ncbi:hypothetical protein [Flavobacterium geliluteum]|uniref:Uncharacterized protein n=1 Tax=Flavobacterium geliluteum TaxID=2816120 RepID=A0A941AVX8_9FLAO|nr:hypothetical protein [Flavobacterium geliluteum]MBP4136705.1 hypothetical protein [Flavobacterium geliluteum]
MDIRAKKRELSLEEFKHLAQPEVWTAIKLDAASGKGFSACHKLIFEKTGMWVEELVPIFRKLDANLNIK